MGAACRSRRTPLPRRNPAWHVRYIVLVRKCFALPTSSKDPTRGPYIINFSQREPAGERGVVPPAGFEPAADGRKPSMFAVTPWRRWHRPELHGGLSLV